MDSSGYISLSKQQGLMREMRIVANNIANMHTTGFRGEQLVFSEFVTDRGTDSSSASMAHASTRRVLTAQGTLNQTGGTFDLGIEGPGYFLVRGTTGEELTRAGQFFVSGNSTLVTSDGHPVLDEGGSTVIVPNTDGPLGISQDGTMSINGTAFAKLAVVLPNNELGLRRVGNTRFAAPDGWEVAEETRVMQGFLEGSNVNAIEQMSRMVEVQRAYEAAQSMQDKEHERINKVIDTIGGRT